MGGLTSGVLLTVLVGAFMWPRVLAPGAANDAEETSPRAGNAQDKPPVKYEFEDVLVDAEVPGPDPGAATSPPTPPAPAEPKPERSALQAGSFRSAEEADALRAKLLLLDIGAVATREALIDGVVWHRVMVGPFATDAERKRAQAKLAGENINSLPVAAPIDMRAPDPIAPAANDAETG